MLRTRHLIECMLNLFPVQKPVEIVFYTYATHGHIQDILFVDGGGGGVQYLNHIAMYAYAYFPSIFDPYDQK